MAKRNFNGSQINQSVTIAEQAVLLSTMRETSFSNMTRMEM